MDCEYSYHEYTQIGSTHSLEKDNQVSNKSFCLNEIYLYKIGQIDFCIHNSLPVNNVWFCLVVFPMDEADIERAKEKSTKFTI